MLDFDKVDISENEILAFDKELLQILLIDRTTNENILWATEDYEELGSQFSTKVNINIDCITGDDFNNVIRPRSVKSVELQKLRARSKAEVFTPSWLCNKQNNLADKSVLAPRSLFNTEEEMGWKTDLKKIQFKSDYSWKDYVLNNVLEVTCGEAPYLVSRYDTTTGEKINLSDRIGLVDRKLRVVSENASSTSEWVEWATKAIQHSYGFELQGDNLLIARENVLFSFSDYYISYVKAIPSPELLKEIAEIISWNLWQMDGQKFVVPFSCHDIEINTTPQLFADDVSTNIVTKPCPGCARKNNTLHTGKYCLVKDWENNITDSFLNITLHKHGHNK